MNGIPEPAAAPNPAKGVSSGHLCSSVKADVDAFAGSADPSDGISMSPCLKRAQEDSICTVPDESSAAAVNGFIDKKLEEYGLPVKAANKLRIAVDEIYNNIRAYSSADIAEITLSMENGAIVMVFRDNGIPYNPLTAQEPDTTLPAEERRIGGLGIFTVKKSMSDMQYRRDGRYNELTVRLEL